MYSQAYDFVVKEYGFQKWENGFYAGEVQGFHTILHRAIGKNLIGITMGIVGAGDSAQLRDKLWELKKEAGLKSIIIEKHSVKLQTTVGLFSNVKKHLRTLFEELGNYLRDHHYQSGCFIKGTGGKLHVVRVGVDAYILSDEGLAELGASLESNRQEIANRSENIFLGIIGALGGSLIGAVLWAVVGALGYYAWMVGFLTIVLAFFGYKFLAGKVGKVGVVLVFLISISSIILGSVVEWNWYNYQYLLEAYGYKANFIALLPDTVDNILYNPNWRGAILKDFALGAGVVCLFGIFSLKGMYAEAAGEYKIKTFN